MLDVSVRNPVAWPRPGDRPGRPGNAFGCAVRSPPATTGRRAWAPSETAALGGVVVAWWRGRADASPPEASRRARAVRGAGKEARGHRQPAAGGGRTERPGGA